MSQYDWADIDPDEEDGTELATRLNAWVAAVQSYHRGSSAPSYVETAMEWQKTVSGTVEERYVYDGAQSLLLYTINPTAHTIQIPAVNLPAASDTVQGAVEIATNAEFLGGTATDRAVTPDNVAALWEKGTDNTGGATITLGDGGSFNLITSTTTITAFAFTTDKAGRTARIRFNTVRGLTHNATSLILPNNGSNIPTAVGDTCEIESLGSGNFRVNRYTRFDGTSLVTGSGVPTGSILDFAGTSAPTGYLLCDGSAVSRSTYAALFALTGTTYGAGNGSTTFNVPDLRGRVTAGKDDMGGASAARLGVSYNVSISNGGTGLTFGVTPAGIAIGMQIFGTGIQAGAVVTAINVLSGTGTMSLTATATGTNSLRFASVDGLTLGAAGGEQSHTLASDEIRAGGGGTSGGVGALIAAAPAAHNNMQPTLIVNKIIKT